MARIVYAWELGEDYGHIASFMPFALKLREQGHEVIFIIRDLSSAESVVGRYGFHLLQSPLWNKFLPELPDFQLSFADILIRHGFHSQEGLTGLVRAWNALLSLLRPDLIVADYSPVALLAARGYGLPRAVFGTGFCAPPRVSPLPALRHWTNRPQESLQHSEQHVLAVANAVLAQMGGQPLQMVAELFDAEENFLCTFPELDHYPHRGDARYWGPIYNISQGVAVDWPAGEGKCIFAYIKAQHPNFETLLDYLGGSGHRVVVFAAGIVPSQIEKFQSGRMVVSSQPVDLSRLIGSCDLAVCHAGHGTLGAMLLAGVPVLLLPLNLEQDLAANRVDKLGAGMVVDIQARPDDFAPLFETLLNEASYKRNAQAFALKHADFNQAAQLDRMAARIGEILAESKRASGSRQT